MGCVNPDGTLSVSARKMLQILSQALAPEEAAAKASEPVFRVRASLRDMEKVGLVEVVGDKYRTTAFGREKAESDK